jgi:hypothetical protein
MKITAVGVGNAFSAINFNQSFVVEEDGRKMLIDCGMQTPNALAKAGFKAKDIDDIYIGGLEYFAFVRYDWGKHPRMWSEGCYAPRLIANCQLLKDLWDKSLRGGLESMEGFVATLETFFIPYPIEPNKSFQWQGWTVDLIQQIHIMSGSIITPSFGIMFSKEGHKSVYFVTDSQHCSPRQMEVYYAKADIIFQDCECTGVNFQFQEGDKVYKDPTGTFRAWPTVDMEIFDLGAQGIEPQEWGCFKFGSGVHANYAQLAGYPSANSVRLSKDIKAKMLLSHYQDFVPANKDMFGNNFAWEVQIKKDGFAGMAHVGDTWEI